MKIYIDFDDVLCETAEYFTKIAKEMFGIEVPYRQVQFFNLQKSFDLNDEQYEALMKAGHLPENLLNYEETPGASEAVNKWVDQGHEVFIITGRPFNSYEPSRKWLDEHHLERVPLFCVDKYGRETAKQDYKYNMTLEELGLNIHRNSKGHRFYTDRDIKILRDVKDLKEQGFLLKSIKLIIHDIDNVRKMNPNEQYKLREELNQKIQDEEENNSNKAKAVNGFMISRSQSVQTDNVVQLENKNMSGAAGQVLNIQKGELGQTAFKQGEQRSVAVPSEEKIKRFELMLRKMVANVVEEGQKESEQRISDNVSTKLMKEINYIMMQKDEMAAKQTKLLEEILQKIQSQSLEEVAATSQIKQLKTKEKKKDDKKDKVKEKGKNKRGLRIFG